MEGDGDKRQRRGGKQSRERTLECTCGEKHRLVRCDTTKGGCASETDQSNDERTLTADRVSDTSTEKKETTEGERVGGDHPLLIRIGNTEICLSPRKREVNDRRVEHNHELRHRDHEQRLPAQRIDIKMLGCGDIAGYFSVNQPVGQRFD